VFPKAGHVLDCRDYYVPVNTDNFGNEPVSRSTLSHNLFVYEIEVNRCNCFPLFHKLSHFITFKAE
jgi:hypothetical protein